MAFLSKDFITALKESKIIEKHDVSAIVALTKEKGLRDGKGYTNYHVRNILEGFTTTDDLVEIVIDYFNAKQTMRNQLHEKQKSFTDKLKDLVA